YRVMTKRDTSKEKLPVSIIQYDSMGREVRRWNLSRAYPVKWVGPTFNAAQSTMGIESLELAFAEFEVRSTRV
ncbi:MAG: phage tail protein, partial [Dehalococcoidia bacterium]|nr:phage tail protein [Dehalococcoidia bacterium]